MSLYVIIHFFIRYKYIAIFPVAVIEGPIISIISGFLVSRHALTLVGAFLVVFIGDLFSDAFFYFVGRGGRKYINKWKFLKISDERIARIERQYKESPWETMIVAKVSYGLGTGFMVASGVSKMSFKNFLTFAGVLNAVRSAVLIAIGYYFGRLAIMNGSKYITYYTIMVCILVPAIYFIRKFWKKNKVERALEGKD